VWVRSRLFLIVTWRGYLGGFKTQCDGLGSLRVNVLVWKQSIFRSIIGVKKMVGDE
jgi:hypothetical protein